MKEKFISIAKITSSAVGSFIGAGFASGQEVLIYFSSFKSAGFIGIIIFSVLFLSFLLALTSLIRKTGAKNVSELTKTIFHPFTAKASAFIFTAFSFVTFGVMASGFRGAVHEFINAPKPLLSVFFLIMISFLLRAGERGATVSNTILAPIMIIASVYITTKLLLTPSPASTDLSAPAARAVFYAGYNIIVTASVVCELSHLLRSRTLDKIFCVLSSFVIMLLILPMHLVFLKFPSVTVSEMPMLTAAKLISGETGIVYFLVLICAMLTTGILCAFSVSNELSLSYKKSSIILPVCALPFAFIDFSALVSQLYSLFGIAGSVLLFSVIIKSLVRPKFPLTNTRHK